MLEEDDRPYSVKITFHCRYILEVQQDSLATGNVINKLCSIITGRWDIHWSVHPPFQQVHTSVDISISSVWKACMLKTKTRYMWSSRRHEDPKICMATTALLQANIRQTLVLMESLPNSMDGTGWSPKTQQFYSWFKNKNRSLQGKPRYHIW